MKKAKQINSPQVGELTITPMSPEEIKRAKIPPRPKEEPDGAAHVPQLTTKELEVLILILTELRAIHEQLKNEVVVRDKYR